MTIGKFNMKRKSGQIAIKLTLQHIRLAKYWGRRGKKDSRSRMAFAM
jgi:hypothetical protein